MASHPPTQGQLKGDIFLLTADQQSFASNQIELLKAIHECGSITKAAKQVGISYKTAWDRIDAMNNMSSQPLVNRATGGARGGGTTLTELGQRIVDGFESIQQEHQRFIERLGDQLHSLGDVANFIKGETVKASARNQFLGTVTRVRPGKVSAEVEVDIGIDQPLVAVITLDSVSGLQLQPGAEVIALVKAPAIMIATDPKLKTSARNNLVGTIDRINQGSVNSEIILDLGHGKAICSIITAASVQALELQPGQTACAVFTAPSVTLIRDR